MTTPTIDPTDLEPIVLRSMRENWPGGAPRTDLSMVAWNVANDVLSHLSRVATPKPAPSGPAQAVEPPAPWLTTLYQAAVDVFAERSRQIHAEGYSTDSDDEYQYDDLARAAAAYCFGPRDDGKPPSCWPWTNASWKPKGRRRNLVRAGALILAEIERIDRVSSPASPFPPATGPGYNLASDCPMPLPSSRPAPIPDRPLPPGVSVTVHGDEWSIFLDGGKYELSFVNHRLTALRYGEPWRDLVGDNLVYLLGSALLERCTGAITPATAPASDPPSPAPTDPAPAPADPATHSPPPEPAPPRLVTAAQLLDVLQRPPAE